MRRLTIILALALAFGLLAGCDSAGLQQLVQAPTAAPAATEAPVSEPTPQRPLATSAPLPAAAPVPTIASALTNALEQQQQLMVELYRRVNPAVVSIEVAGHHPSVDGAPSSDAIIPLSQGSGFLYDDQGHIVTNNHVVESGEAFQVRFADGTVIEARLIGRDPGSDLAVLKVDELPPQTAPLTLADSREIQVGETAVAIGNPFGLQNTLTVGVISGIGRSLDGPSSPQGGRFSIPNVIQTDASINPGNSGGPLLNVRGEVIGINTAIRSETGVFEGIGYAVPSNAVRRVAPALIDSGRYEHPWIGISMATVEPLMARQLDLGARQGVLVTGVQPNSPAERAGLNVGTRQENYNGRPVPVGGDIVTAINGQPVHSADDLISYLELETSVGQTVTFTVQRDGAEQKVPLTLAARPGE